MSYGLDQAKIRMAALFKPSAAWADFACFAFIRDVFAQPGFSEIPGKRQFAETLSAPQQQGVSR